VIRALIAAALAAPLLSGCVIYADDSPQKDVIVSWTGDQTAPSLETVRSAKIADGRLTVRVESNGCTDATHFAVDLTPGGDGWTDVALRRTAQDLCKALVPDGVEVSWTLAELGVEPGTQARLINPTKL
jgi:enhancing lycopene biosynthesis protein 2